MAAHAAVVVDDKVRQEVADFCFARLVFERRVERGNRPADLVNADDERLHIGVRLRDLVRCRGLDHDDSRDGSERQPQPTVVNRVHRDPLRLRIQFLLWNRHIPCNEAAENIRRHTSPYRPGTADSPLFPLKMLLTSDGTFNNPQVNAISKNSSGKNKAATRAPFKSVPARSTKLINMLPKTNT